MHDGNISSLVFFVFSLQGVSSMVFDEQPSLSLVSRLKCFYTLRSINKQFMRLKKDVLPSCHDLGTKMQF